MNWVISVLAKRKSDGGKCQICMQHGMTFYIYYVQCSCWLVVGCMFHVHFVSFKYIYESSTSKANDSMWNMITNSCSDQINGSVLSHGTWFSIFIRNRIVFDLYYYVPTSVLINAFDNTIVLHQFYIHVALTRRLTRQRAMTNCSTFHRQEFNQFHSKRLQLVDWHRRSCEWILSTSLIHLFKFAPVLVDHLSCTAFELQSIDYEVNLNIMQLERNLSSQRELKLIYKPIECRHFVVRKLCAIV